MTEVRARRYGNNCTTFSVFYMWKFSGSHCMRMKHAASFLVCQRNQAKPDFRAKIHNLFGLTIHLDDFFLLSLFFLLAMD